MSDLPLLFDDNVTYMKAWVNGDVFNITLNKYELMYMCAAQMKFPGPHHSQPDFPLLL